MALLSNVTAPPPPLAAAVTGAPAWQLISFQNYDLLHRSLTEIDHCNDFSLVDFLADIPLSSSSPLLSQAQNLARKPLTEFTLFSKLCSELQIKVWAHNYTGLEGRKLNIVPPLAEVPPLLQACFDSRKLGLGIYKRQEHAATPSVPSFVSMIDFQKDTLQLTARGVYENPQRDSGCSHLYFYESNSSSPPIQILDFLNNLLIYATHHYPDLCKHVQRMALRTCYLDIDLGIPSEWSPIADFLKETFPILKSVGIISLGVGEVPGFDEDWSQPRKQFEKYRESCVRESLVDLQRQGRLEYINPPAFEF
ncbi:uncharacterized protein RAG0_05188 [Rhynchosporium agropyri]|uniref:2EXR domain-containing protein n=1 Tax=Rhynchosporium agropyri TaxID=914238 RepID=A0A1E1KC15_9HELO|nr:uncharacterized protein RAG0_05188 [Rhynchosporium agropyri]